MVVETCAGYCSALDELAITLSFTDVIVSLAVLAAESTFPYVRPRIVEKDRKIMVLKACRHPVIEATPNAPTFIPNDVVLGKNDQLRFLLLTGANMGGKSTYLRSCALTVLMGQIGSFVPCSEAEFSIVDGIYTRIGSCDFQIKGVSTFMAEMIDSASILESATADSLVIIDELGRGTSTFDGFGLAWAIARDILERIQCRCIFATHFHEMTELEKENSSLQNIRVDTHLDNDGNLILLYRIVPGIAERSFGLNIAKLVGLPHNVIQDAIKMLDDLESNVYCDADEKNMTTVAKLKDAVQHNYDSELERKVLTLISDSI
ncbi:hypothetical protein AB6A40_008011 [Gnathostoma spinigerum]|uniref:DNA mismatch repair proteins mutS family domain-containing protein n=1 Tax=Gnathostoma spinigerum TaxID=75299 RepID=A0ABD6EX97_9BILA